MIEPRMSSQKNLLLTIRGLLPSLNEQEQKVGQYVVDHPEQVVHLSVTDLAQRCVASEATVVRFCRKVGTEGYQNLKIVLAQELNSTSAIPYAPINSGDTIGAAVRKVITADVKALEDTLTVLDLVALEEAADVLWPRAASTSMVRAGRQWPPWSCSTS